MRCLQICIQIHNYIICSCCVSSIRPCHFISRICKLGINFLYLSHSQPSKDVWWIVVIWCTSLSGFYHLVLDWFWSKTYPMPYLAREIFWMIYKYHLLMNEYYLLANFGFLYSFLKFFTSSVTLQIWPIYVLLV